MRRNLALPATGGKVGPWVFSYKKAQSVCIWELVSLFQLIDGIIIVEDLGSTGANTQKRPIQRPLTCQTSPLKMLRLPSCWPFAMPIHLTKIGQFSRNHKGRYAMTLLANQWLAAFEKAKEWKHLSLMILGSGLGTGWKKSKISQLTALKFQTGVVQQFVSHTGRIGLRWSCWTWVLALQGRFPLLRSPLEVVTFPVRVMKKFLGCEGVLVTNAAGGVDMDQVPWWLSGATSTWLVKRSVKNTDQTLVTFPDMSKAYTQNIVRLLIKVTQTNWVSSG